MYAIIPARSGSKRIKNKNIIQVGVHPLISYTIMACILSKNIKKVFVSTECKKIAEISKKYGAEVPFLRPNNLSEDNSSDHGFLKHFFDNVDCNEVALMRPTSPLRSNKEIDKCIEYYYGNSLNNKCTGLRSLYPSNHSPYKMMKLNKDKICSGFFKDFMGEKLYTNLPNQTFPTSYTPNGYIDIVQKDTVMNSNSSFGDKIYGYITEQIIDIDNQFDLDIVKNQIKSKYDFLSVHLDKIL